MNTQQEFKITKGWRLAGYIFGVIFISGAVIFGIHALMEPNPWRFGGLSILVFAMGLYGIVNATRTKITITDNSVIKQGTFRTKTLLFKDVKGVSIDDKIINIEHVDKPLSSMIISDYTYLGESDKLIRTLRGKFKDLDKAHHVDELKEIMHDEKIGFDLHNRQQNLAKVKQICSYLNYAGIGIALWCFLYPHPYKAAMIGAMVFPLVAVYFLNRYKYIIGVVENKNSPRPSLGYALLLPGVALAVRVLADDELLHYTNIILPVLISFAAACFTFYCVLPKTGKNSEKYTWLALGVFALPYCYGTIISLNCDFDHQHSKKDKVRITDMHKTTGKHNTYYLTVTHWGDRMNNEDVTIDRNLYNNVKTGDTITIYQKPGLLYIPWYFVDK